MIWTQNETGRIRISDFGIRSADCEMWSAFRPAARKSAIRNRQSAFTLTELLVVITIIAILASLITGAAINALNKAKQAAITLELQQLSAAMEDFKNELGAYPPNGMSGGTNFSNTAVFNTIQSDFERLFKKAFPRNEEPIGLIRTLAGNVASGRTGNPSDLPGGMTSTEALVFWLGGFSKDTRYPITGDGGPSFVDGSDANTTLEGSDEVIEDREFRYEFDLGRLIPRQANGTFDDVTNGRFIEYDDPRNPAVRRRINLWLYAPSGSQLPIAYFDTSRHDPVEYDADLSGVTGAGIYAIKQYRAGFNESTTPTVQDVVFTNKDTFQILHAGLDDVWGDGFSLFNIKLAANANDASAVLVAPTGPFIGDIADTLGHFMTGTLEDKQNEQ